MIGHMKSRLARSLGVLEVEWVKKGGSKLGSVLGRSVIRPPRSAIDSLIDERVAITARAGERPLWDGYGQKGSKRTSDQVRTDAVEGRFYRLLVDRLSPYTVVEFGTAFGVSGMYWLSGLEARNEGCLFTFEPNEDWARYARDNLEAIGRRFVLTEGTFEESLDVLDDRLIDIAFIDAIHTSDFVEPQFALVADRCRPGSVVVLDDIDFSDDMRRCWQRIAHSSGVKASATVSPRVGVVAL